MEPGRDLSGASREALLAIIAEQAEVIARLAGRITDLERRLGSSGGKGVPGTKPAVGQRTKASGTPRKRRAHGFARARMLPTATERHAAEACPDCGTALCGGWVVRRRELIELPVAPVTVTEHLIVARTCPRCRRRVLPHAPLLGLVSGKQRLGARLVSLIVTLREAARLPIRTIQMLLRQLYGVAVSLGAITAASDRVAARGATAVAHLRDEIRGSPVVHADETGWRESGRNGYAWTFCTATTRYFLRRGREKGVVDEVLGADFAGVLCSDFYAAYHHYPGVKQRCWVHLLRDLHDLITLYPDDAALTAWTAQVRAVYNAATAFVSLDERQRIKAAAHFTQRLLALCAPATADSTAVQARLCRRIQRHSDELFVFVANPTVPPDNNLAERSVRPLVTSRKISGGTRSPRGSATKMALASLFGTWHARGLNPFDQCHQLLTSPQL